MYNRYISRVYMIKIRSDFIKTILIALVFLFATLFSNFWFTVAYAYNTKSNSSNLYTSNLGVGSSDNDNNNLLTLHNITNKVSFTGEVNVSNLPNLHTSKPGIIIDSKEQYLTRNYTGYINAKKQAELVKSTNTTTKVIEIQRPDLLLLPNSNNESNNNNNNSATILNTGFEGLSQVCCIPPDIQLAA